ncbi:MAG: ISAzo13-like element transposase-related protein, partial [Gammaproteobacteria bacterium]
RCRLWKLALHDLAIQLGIPIQVCHFPPGTSKWNKIEHRMFCHITQNWRGRPLVSHEVIINLIASTTTRTGLKIQAELDKSHYPTGIRVSDEELAAVNLKRADFHGDWNYIILPTRTKR